MSVGEVCLEFKDAERNLWLDVPLKGELKEMIEVIAANLNVHPIIVFSIDRDGVTAKLALSNRHRDIVKSMLREGRLPPVPLIQVRLWVSPATEPTNDNDLNSFVTYQNIAPMPADAETDFIKVVLMVFFAALTNLTSTILDLIGGYNLGLKSPVA
jgi:hypothetical protein